MKPRVFALVAGSFVAGLSVGLFTPGKPSKGKVETLREGGTDLPTVRFLRTYPEMPGHVGSVEAVPFRTVRDGITTDLVSAPEPDRTVVVTTDNGRTKVFVTLPDR